MITTSVAYEKTKFESRWLRVAKVAGVVGVARRRAKFESREFTVTDVSSLAQGCIQTLFLF
jgi:hypothetical protein